MNDQCSHLWVFDHKDHDDMYMRCRKCGTERICSVEDEQIHPFVANRVARELNIRHDNSDGDV